MPSAGEDRTVDRQAGKQGEKYGKKDLVPSAPENRSVVEQAGKHGEKCGKMNWSQARERTELLFNRQDNMLPAPNVKYSIPVCKEIKAREK